MASVFDDGLRFLVKQERILLISNFVRILFNAMWREYFNFSPIAKEKIGENVRGEIEADGGGSDENI